MVDFQVISKVLRKFLSTKRMCGYHSNPEYEHLEERNKEIYLSSCFYKSHWSYLRAQTYFKAMVEGKKYFICSLPYQLAIKEGLLMKNQVLDEMSESDFDPIGFSMEMEALWFGENESSYFKYEELNVNRKIEKAFYPSDITEFINDKKIHMKKNNDEIRVISVDVAAAGGSKNDATAIFCARLIPTNNGYERQIVYSETFEGGVVTDQSLRIKQLFHEFSADYLVLDTMTMGLFLLDILGQTQVDPRNGQEYPPLKSMNNEEHARRCVYPDAKKAVYSVTPSAKLNSQNAVSMKNALKSKKLHLMVHENDARELLRTIKGYDNFSEDLKLKLEMPFVQNSLLINETINLDASYNDLREVTLKEMGSARKDRYSSLSYLNSFADYLEQKNRKKKSEAKATSMFMMKPPTPY